MHKLKRPVRKYRSTILSLIIKLINRFRPDVPDNWTEFEGRVIFITPKALAKHKTVQTPLGFGEVDSVFRDHKGKPEWVIVNLYRGYPKQFRIQDLQQIVIYHCPNKNEPAIGESILLTPAHYRYIYTNYQNVKYRVSNRRYAILSNETRDQYGYVKTLHKFRYGKRMLDLIRKKKYIVSKYTELL